MFLEVCWLPGSAQCAEPGLVLALKERFEQFVSDDTRVLWHWRYSSSPLTPTGASPRAPPAHRLVASTAVISAPSRQFVKSARCRESPLVPPKTLAEGHVRLTCERASVRNTEALSDESPARPSVPAERLCSLSA